MAALLAILGACAPGALPPPPAAGLPSAEDAAATGRYVGGPVALQCAPFARALSGVDLRGPAADWWQKAEARYARSSRPAVGAVLAFRRTSRLPDGHAAVVSGVISQRTILVTQANWVAGRVTEDMPVLDVSPANDWSAVRVWWPPSGQMGIRHYPTWGFILPDRPISRDGLEASTREVMRVSSSE
ncbi:MAG: CHAP domain-containing protein [Rhodospirillales bacterium]|nr:CHAP domain-containing protein [Rhodospirillales bacterium]